jgi:hypothetical protein
MPVILTTQEAEIRRIMVQSQPGKIHNTKNRAGRMAQVIGCRPSKYKFLSSNPTLLKKRKNLEPAWTLRKR